MFREHLVPGCRQMVGVDDELPYAAIVASAHGMQNKGLMEKGNQRLGQNAGERAQAGTQPGAENKRTGNAEACCDMHGTSLLGERLFFKRPLSSSFRDDTPECRLFPEFKGKSVISCFPNGSSFTSIPAWHVETKELSALRPPWPVPLCIRDSPLP